MQPDESVVSLVQRHCEANFVARMSDMLRLIERVSGQPLKDVRDIVLSRQALQALEQLTALEPGSLDNQYVAPIGTTHLRVGHHEWRLGLRRPEAQAFCPACFGPGGYARVGWDFLQAPICLTHDLALLDSCPACKNKLRHRRTTLLRCGECGFALEGTSQHPVSKGASAIASMVQRPAMVPMGDPATTSPIDQRDLSALLRMCTPRVRGMGGLESMARPVTKLTIEERVCALERMGTAWIDRRIDSKLLRAVVLERWPSMGLLPPLARTTLLELAADQVELPLDVLPLLCKGDDVHLDVSAATRFSGRPPQLFTEDAVAEFLGIDLHALGVLRGHDGLSPALTGEGHDMDQVLTLQRLLDSLLSLEQVDAVTGAPGLACALLELKMLKALLQADGSVVGIYLDSLEKLLAGLEGALETRCPMPADAVPLSTAVEDGTPLMRIGWMVSQVRSGSLAAYAWHAPHRLVDLVVDAQRLHSLTLTPSGERSECDPNSGKATGPCPKSTQKA